MESKNNGFTLIELMISVVIVGLLVAIAYPGYARYVQGGWRRAAQLCLLEITQSMEQRYSTEFTFRLVDSDGDTIDDLLDGGCALEGGMPARYQFSFTPALVAAGSSVFSVLATPQPAQQGDRCNTLSVNSRGVTGPVQPDCW